MSMTVSMLMFMPMSNIAFGPDGWEAIGTSPLSLPTCDLVCCTVQTVQLYTQRSGASSAHVAILIKSVISACLACLESSSCKERRRPKAALLALGTVYLSCPRVNFKPMGGLHVISRLLPASP